MERDRFNRKEEFPAKFESLSSRFSHGGVFICSKFCGNTRSSEKSVYGVICVSRTMSSSRQILKVIGNLWRQSTQLERALSR
jgi:hypothetical protein